MVFRKAAGWGSLRNGVWLPHETTVFASPPSGGGEPPSNLHVVVLMGQSNIEYALNNGGPYTNATLLANIPITTVNATYIGPDNSDNSGIVRAIPVTQANVTARRINTSIAQASQWLAYIAPGKQFVFVDGAQSGTSRWQLSDDTDTERLWEDFTAVISLAETIGPINQVIEWWYANDAGDLAAFTTNFAPFYLRQYDNGTAFPLGTTFNTRRWDHVLWDANAASLDDKGLGVFNRRTKWTYVENHHKDSSQANSDGIAAFWADSRVQAFAAPKGVWAGLYANDDAHALTAEADGQVFLQWPITTSVARAVGVTINEPTFVSGPSGIVMSPDGLGTWAEILVDLPNGGTLTTVRIKEGRGAVPSLQLPFQQPLTGMEIMRDGAGLPKLPVYRASETLDENGATIDNRTKGVVEITDTGSGAPRRGRIRITPTVPFANNDRIYPLHLKDQSPYPQTFVPDYVNTEDPPDLVYQAKVRAAATKSWLDFPVERVTALEDPAATYKYPGVPVRPWSAPYIVSGVTEAPFTFEPRSVVTSASSHLRDNPYTPTVFAGNEGMLSIWFKCTEVSWPSPVTLMQMRNGGTIIFALTTASSGRVSSPLSLTDGNTILPTAVTNDFAVGVWNNLLLSWKLGPGGWTQVVRNGGAVRSGSVPAATPRLRMTDLGITAISIGAQTAGTTPWPGEIGHVYINLNQALDLNTPANVAKFYSAGAPVSLGKYGQLPTGSNPAFYFDGPAAAWNNQGTELDVTAIGTFTAGSAPGP